MINPKEIHPFSGLQHDAPAHVEHLKRTGRFAAYGPANTAAIVGIHRGLQGMFEGTGEDADDAFASLERELGIPEELIA